MRNRRALSSVVGMVFAIIALTTTVTYITYSMNTLSQYNQVVLQKNQQNLDVGKEKFLISSVTIPNNNKFAITVANTGTLPINFTKLWIQDTTVTDSFNSYVPLKGFVAPGATLTNIGQDPADPTIVSTDSYIVKLVTSRGNSQQFTMNSASTGPLNIQLMFLPAAVSSGFKSELLMVVINNGTSTLTNVTPSALVNPTYGVSNSGNLQCNAGSVSPAKYTTLAPGSVAYFMWDITTVAGNAGDTCTYNLTQPLQGGYVQAVSPQSLLTITAVSLASTTYSQNSGVVTNDYTAFKWTEGGSWKTQWAFPGCTTVDFQIKISNNNQTAGGYSLWLSKNTQMFFMPTSIPSNAKITPSTYYLVNSVTLSPLGLTGYVDNSTAITNQGGIATLNFGATSPGSPTQATSACGNGSPPYGLQTGTAYYGTIVIYGKFTKLSTDTGGNYAQAIPFLAVIAT